MPNWIDEADFMLSVARGSIVNYKGINKFGFNPDLDTGTGDDIWDLPQVYVYPTVARLHDIVSSDTEDDGVATGTLTLVNAVAITPSTATIQSVSPVAINGATGTATLSAVVAADFCTINGLVYTAVSGSTVEGEFDIDGNNDADAVDLARAINEDTRNGTEGDCSATSNTNVVTITTDVTGVDGNDVTLTTDDATIVVNGSGTLTGGVDADITTVNGLVYTAITGSKSGDFTLFSIDVSDDATATDLADSITQDGRSGSLNDVTAVSATDTVTCTQTVAGVGGNATTLTSTDEAGRLNNSGNTFTGGLDADTATVNGLVYTAISGDKAGDNTLFDIDGDDTVDALDLKDSIINDARAGITVPTAVLVITSATNVVTINGEGTIGNLVDISGTANITASSATLTDVDVGAHTVLIEGLDTNFNEISETIALNGTTIVVTTQAYLRINRMIVTLAGTDGQNNGIIKATAQTDSTISANIRIGKNQTNMAIYTVPANKTGFIVNVFVTVAKLLESEIDAELVIRPENQVFQVKANLGANSTGNSSSQHFFKPYLPVTEKSDIKLSATTSTDATAVSGGFDLILVDN